MAIEEPDDYTTPDYDEIEEERAYEAYLRTLPPQEKPMTNLQQCMSCGGKTKEGICKNKNCSIYKFDQPTMFAEMDLLLESL